jgi:hypothetical protein
MPGSNLAVISYDWNTYFAPNIHQESTNFYSNRVHIFYQHQDGHIYEKKQVGGMWGLSSKVVTAFALSDIAAVCTDG